MARLLLVNRGAGAPEWCSLEVWQALAGRPVFALEADAFTKRLSEAGFDVRLLDASRPATAAAAVAPAVLARRPELKLLGAPHAHDEASDALRAVAKGLADEALAHGEIAFLLPPDCDPVVRAVLERALQGDVEIEVVVGISPRGHLLLELVRTMDRLRSPGGCPWDAEQTHQTLAKHLLDEAYELLSAIEDKTSKDIAEELGDVLLQVVFHARIAQDDETFDIDDVAAGLIDKLVTRHPHVFGDVTVRDANEVVANWDVIKEAEKGRKSVHEDIPEALPALAWTQKLQRRAGKAGFDWTDAQGPAEKMREEIGELERAKTPEEREHELGDVLLAVVALARHLDIDAESALRKAGRRFRSRVAYLESAARERGVALRDLSDSDLGALWTEAKQR